MINNENSIKDHCTELLELTFNDGLCECDLSGISVGLLISVLEKMGYEVISDNIAGHPSLDTNGWEIDFWSKIYLKGKDEPLYIINGCVMTGELWIKKYETY